MPLYEYRCDTCGGEFEQVMRYAEADVLPTCPACGSAETSKKISRVGSFGEAHISGGATSASSCGSGSGFS